ncbi:RNA polymerase sigma factor [Aurantibacillus circumpalustris]|uniref:RNA polymerase sigma factor n=1 Tax=Aurantibacillus circumpalustris TaxID=3036359 RepID=UPI00295AB526|nr:sigma-70 family RNA polymerase sigma factor [Aurantibacillus circumpalustris]
MNLTKIIFDFKCQIIIGYFINLVNKSTDFLVFDNKYTNSSDKELITFFSETDDNRYVGILYQRYSHLVLGLCFKYLKNKNEAEDAVIQIFTKLLQDLKKHKIEYFKSWLYVYSKNFCLMELRKRQSLLKKELELKENAHFFVDMPDLDHLKEKERQIGMMESAIQFLNKEQKMCIELFYFQNKSYIEISEVTGFSNNDVKSYIQNGKRNLKIKIESLINEQPEG